MKSIVAGFILLCFQASVAQIDLSQPKPGSKTTIDNKPCEVCVRYIGETYNYIAPFTGWSDIPLGILEYRYEKDKRNPYDNHPYLLYSDNRIPPNTRTDKAYYRVIDGYRYSGEITDSIVNKQNTKEKSFKGTYKNGLLDGAAIFYFTSADASGSANIKIGEVKSEGNFSKGKMVGKWNYYGYTSPLISKDKYLLEERVYDETSIFPIKGKHYRLDDDKKVVVGTEYETERNLLKFVNQRYSSGKLQSREALANYSIVGSTVEDFIAEYDCVNYYENKKVQSRGKYIRKPKYYEKNGLWQYYNEKGKLTSEINYVDGKTEGLSKIFYDNGNKKKNETYTNGTYRLVDYWDEKGRQLVKEGNGRIETKTGDLLKIEVVENGVITTSYEKN